MPGALRLGGLWHCSHLQTIRTEMVHLMRFQEYEMSVRSSNFLIVQSFFKCASHGACTHYHMCDISWSKHHQAFNRTLCQGGIELRLPLNPSGRNTTAMFLDPFGEAQICDFWSTLFENANSPSELKHVFEYQAGDNSKTTLQDTVFPASNKKHKVTISTLNLWHTTLVLAPDDVL